MAIDIKNINLAPPGKLKIEWAARNMPVLPLIKKRFAKEKPFEGLTIGTCLHITSETANLLITLKTGGAKVAACASNPLSTQDEVAASLAKDFGIDIFAIKGENRKTYYRHLAAILDLHPQITMDDGADLITLLHTKRKKQLKEIIGSSEETTTGVIRLKAMEKDKALKIPVMAVNESETKHFFDNYYGTGQSTIDGIMRATNILFAGKTVVVCGYGFCGRGVSLRAKGMGANVIICEVEPVRALQALLDGFRVMPISRAAKVGDIFITVTGDKNVIDINHLKAMKNGAVLANAGHFNCEIAMEKLEKTAVQKRQIRDYVAEYTLKVGQKEKKIFVLAEGRLVNLAAAEGHPAEVMDMSFANQALAAEFFVKNKGRLEPKVYCLPENLDKEIARLKLKSMGVKIDNLTREQAKYLAGWKEGT